MPARSGPWSIRVFERSQGNAFFAEELATIQSEGARRELPPMLRDILLVRIESRSAAAQELMRVVAVGGARVPERLLATVSRLSETERDEALREAVEHRLLVPAGEDIYGFRHALLREAVYQELLPGERNRLHAAYGDALAARPDLAAVMRRPPPIWRTTGTRRTTCRGRSRPRSRRLGRPSSAPASRRPRAHYERALELWDRVADASRARARIAWR